MLLELLFGFLVLVAASYVGTTMALRGFFGRERYDGRFESDGSSPPDDGETPGTDGREGRRTESRDARNRDDENRTDDVPRASDVSGRGE